MIIDRETHAQGNPDIAIEKQRKIQEERELARAETEKVRKGYFARGTEIHVGFRV